MFDLSLMDCNLSIGVAVISDRKHRYEIISIGEIKATITDY